MAILKPIGSRQEALSWSQLSASQRAFLLCGARYNRDEIRNGKLYKRGAAKNPKAELMLATFAVAKDQERERDRSARASNLALLASMTPDQVAMVTRKVKEGRARGANELNRKRSGALQMGYSLKANGGTARNAGL